MAETDSLLKRLVHTFLIDFATWLLGTQVQTARLLPNELPGTTVALDQVCHLTLDDGCELLWHMEFQGRRSHVPMSWRRPQAALRAGGRVKLRFYCDS